MHGGHVTQKHQLANVRSSMSGREGIKKPGVEIVIWWSEISSEIILQAFMYSSTLIFKNSHSYTPKMFRI